MMLSVYQSIILDSLIKARNHYEDIEERYKRGSVAQVKVLNDRY